jgi:cytochrome c
VRLSREKRPGSAVLARIDGRSFQLAGGGRDAWAPDAAADGEIQAAMRTGLDLIVETRSTLGRLVRDHYRLRGAATAIDAAAVACAHR